MAWPRAPGSGSPAWVAAHALAPQALLVRWGVAAVQALAPLGAAAQVSEPPVQPDGASLAWEPPVQQGAAAALASEPPVQQGAAARVLAPQGQQSAAAPAQRGVVARA